MKRYLFIFSLLLLGACHKREDRKPDAVPYVTLPGTSTTTTVSTEPLHILAGGQSNNTYRINNGTEGVPTYFVSALKVPAVQVNTAVGGSSQKEWAPGSAYYLNLVSKGRAMGHVDVLLWWQGEAEGMFGKMADAEGWAQNFTQFAQAVRRDLNQPHLMIIYAQIGENPAGDSPSATGVYASWKEVQDQQASIYLPDTYIVKTDDQHFYGWVHTDEAGYRAVASRMAMIFDQNKN